MVGHIQIFRLARSADPTERPETIVEAHRSHDVLHIGRILESPVRVHHIGPRMAAFKQERVPVIEEIHALGSASVDGGHLAAQGSIHLFLELFRLLAHHAVAFLQAQAHRIIASGKRIVQGALVRTEVHLDIVLHNVFPHVHRVAEIGERPGHLFFPSLGHAGEQLVQILMDLIHPALLVTLAGRLRVDFGRHRNHPGYVPGLGLGTAHAAQTAGNEQGPRRLLADTARGVQDRNRGPVHDALRADIHVRTRRHLAILGHTQGIVTFPVVGLAMVGNHHPVGHHHPRRVLVRGEKPQRMPRIHDQGLLVGHFRQIFHDQTVLRPVLENGTVPAIGNQFVRMLRHRRIQVILNHQHDSCRLTAFGRILLDRAGEHRVIRTETVHVNAPVGFQFLGELRRQDRMVLGGEVTQSIAQCQFLLFGAQDVLALGRMVHTRIVRLRFRQYLGNPFPDGFLKFFSSHIVTFSNLIFYPDEPIAANRRTRYARPRLLAASSRPAGPLPGHPADGSPSLAFRGVP